jgi:hypothetical protein
LFVSPAGRNKLTEGASEMATTETPTKHPFELRAGDNVYLNIAETVNDSPDYAWCRIDSISLNYKAQLARVFVTPLAFPDQQFPLTLTFRAALKYGGNK